MTFVVVSLLLVTGCNAHDVVTSVGPSPLPASVTPDPPAPSSGAVSAVATLPSTVAPSSAQPLAPIGVIAILRSDSQNHSGRLWVTSSDGTGAHELLSKWPEFSPFDQDGLGWVPDGTALVFSEFGKVYLSTASGARPQVLDTGCELRCLGDHFPSYSNDGTRIVFNRSIPGGGLLATMDVASGLIRELDATTLRDSWGTAWHVRPRWSADGHQIVFSQFHAIQGGPDGFFVVDADGTHLHHVPAKGIPVIDPEWSPDGSSIVFISSKSSRHPGTADVYMIRPDGSGLRRLTSGGIASGATWTADGRILFTRIPGSNKTRAEGSKPLVTEVWVIDADGTNAERLSTLPRNGKAGTDDGVRIALQPTR